MDLFEPGRIWIYPKANVILYADADGYLHDFRDGDGGGNAVSSVVAVIEFAALFVGRENALRFVKTDTRLWAHMLHVRHLAGLRSRRYPAQRQATLQSFRTLPLPAPPPPLPRYITGDLGKRRRPL